MRETSDRSSADSAASAGARRSWRQRLLPWILRVYPPYVGAGIRVRRAPDGGYEVSMKLRRWNANYHGTHFGGSLYSMCDPFFVLVLVEELGAGYTVWDKTATIRFRRPGRGTVRARFAVDAAEVERIRAAADAGETVEPTFFVEVLGPDGRAVADVEKVLHVRRRAPQGSA